MVIPRRRLRWFSGFVTMLAAKTKNGHAGTSKTDQSGAYFFGSLAPGTYYVAADPGNWGNSVRQIPVDSSGKTTKLHDLITFYPTALSLAGRARCGPRERTRAVGDGYSHPARLRL